MASKKGNNDGYLNQSIRPPASPNPFWGPAWGNSNQATPLSAYPTTHCTNLLNNQTNTLNTNRNGGFTGDCPIGPFSQPGTFSQAPR